MVTRYTAREDWLGVEMAEFGEYVGYDDFHDLVRAFDKLIKQAKATVVALSNVPELDRSKHAHFDLGRMDDAITRSLGLLESAVKEAKEFE